jgi:hypothetical protein
VSSNFGEGIVGEQTGSIGRWSESQASRSEIGGSAAIAEGTREFLHLLHIDSSEPNRLFRGIEPASVEPSSLFRLSASFREMGHVFFWIHGHSCIFFITPAFDSGSRISRLGAGAFFNYGWLESIYIHSFLQTLCHSCLNRCLRLTELTFERDSQDSEIHELAGEKCS